MKISLIGPAVSREMGQKLPICQGLRVKRAFFLLAVAVAVADNRHDNGPVALFPCQRAATPLHPHRPAPSPIPPPKPKFAVSRLPIPLKAEPFFTSPRMPFASSTKSWATFASVLSRKPFWPMRGSSCILSGPVPPRRGNTCKVALYPCRGFGSAHSGRVLEGADRRP